jgi:hypothetical protein
VLFRSIVQAGGASAPGGTLKTYTGGSVVVTTDTIDVGTAGITIGGQGNSVDARSGGDSTLTVGQSIIT